MDEKAQKQAEEIRAKTAERVKAQAAPMQAVEKPAVEVIELSLSPNLYRTPCKIPMQTKKDISRKKRGARRRKRKRKPKKRGSAWRKPKSERSVPHRKWKTQ